MQRNGSIMELQGLDIPAKNERGALAGFSNAAQGVIGKVEAHVILVVKF